METLPIHKHKRTNMETLPIHKSKGLSWKPSQSINLKDYNGNLPYPQKLKGLSWIPPHPKIKDYHGHLSFFFSP